MSDQEIETTVKGVISSGTDERDYSYLDLSLHLPTDLAEQVGEGIEIVIPQYTPISNQGSAGTCVTNAICDALEILIGVTHGKKEVRQLSRRMLYFLARTLSNTTDRDSGTSPRLAFMQARTVGVVEEKYFPYSDDLEDLCVSPPLDCYTMASNNRINSFYRMYGKNINVLARQIADCIVNGHPVVFCTPVSREFQRYRGEKKVFGRMGSSVGNHCMIIVGFRYKDDKLEFLWRNSWGPNWGADGHCWVSQDTLFSCFEIWTATKIKVIE